MKKRTLLGAALSAVLVSTLWPVATTAQEVTLKLHQFLPAPATVPKLILKPWAERVEEASDGRIKIDHFDAMALGGTPPSLMDQAIDGSADLIMTVVGYTPGRFPKTEVFELPFMMTDPIATSKAFMDLVETDLQGEEYKDVKILGAWVHGPGVVHSRNGVTKLEDMEGLKMRGPTRVITDMLRELGATPVGMPLPAIPESLSKGVIDGTVIPWEVTPAIKLSELIGHGTEFTNSKEALYTATIVLAMNKAKYDAMPDDLKAILDAESGQKLSEFAAQVMYERDDPGRELALSNGSEIIQLDEAEIARWKEKAQPVIERWKEEMAAKDIDGEALIEKARALIEKHGG